jgi:hypothetical protein
MIRLSTFLLIATVLFTSCKKEKKEFVLEISSTIKSQVQNVNVPNAKVLLYVQELSSNGVFSSAYIKKAETSTDANGNFTIKFEKGDAISYRLEISHEKYFDLFMELNDQNVKPDSPYTEDIKMMPEAYVKVRAINKNKFNENDVFSISTYVENSDCECCKNFNYNLVGVSDTSYTCLLYGPKNYKIIWSVKRDNFNNAGPTMETVFCPALETKLIEINY